MLVVGAFVCCCIRALYVVLWHWFVSFAKPIAFVVRRFEPTLCFSHIVVAVVGSCCVLGWCSTTALPQKTRKRRRSMTNHHRRVGVVDLLVQAYLFSVVISLSSIINATSRIFTIK